MRLLRWIFKHRWHSWEPSCWNVYMVPTEQTCTRCGARRHLRTFDEIRGQDWRAARPGEHPLAADMRAWDVTRNYENKRKGFKR